MYTFFFRKRPPIELLISGAALDLAERRISARDHVILIEEIKSNLARDRYAMFYSLFDDTHHRSGERHVYFLSYFDWVKSTPVSKLVSLKPSPSKDAITNAKEDMINIEQAKAEVFSYFLHWGLDNPVVLSDLVLLSKNLQHSRIDDIITDDFVHGRSCVSLFRHVCVTMAPLATTCVIVELLYSQMKIVMEANETSESVDDELRLIFNVLNDDR
jgi:bacteriorhodopsin